MKQQRFPIGLKFMPRNLKYPKEETIVDCLKTYNSKGDLVDLTYVTEHEFMGQKVRRGCVSDTHIAMSLQSQGRNIEDEIIKQ